MIQDKQEIKCTILTLRSENVMVPNASIAEIISAKDARAVTNAPTWYLGTISWRGIDVPLVSYEAAGGDKAKTVNLNTQVAVLYTVGENVAHPYIGLVISGVPHETRFSRDQIVTDAESLLDEYPNPMMAQKTRINGAAVSILDLDAIASMISEAETMH